MTIEIIIICSNHCTDSISYWLSVLTRRFWVLLVISNQTKVTELFLGTILPWIHSLHWDFPILQQGNKNGIRTEILKMFFPLYSCYLTYSQQENWNKVIFYFLFKKNKTKKQKNLINAPKGPLLNFTNVNSLGWNIPKGKIRKIDLSSLSVFIFVWICEAAWMSLIRTVFLVLRLAAYTISSLIILNLLILTASCINLSPSWSKY